MRLQSIPWRIYALVSGGMVVAYFVSALSIQAGGASLIAAALIAFGLPVLLLKYTLPIFRPLAITYVTYSTLFYGMSVVNFLFDPTIGRYNGQGVEISVVDVIVCLVVYLLCSMALLLSMMPVFSTEIARFEKAKHKLDEPNINTSLLVIAIITLAIRASVLLIFGNPLAGGGMQNRGEVHLYSIASNFDPSIPILLYLYYKNQRTTRIQFASTDFLLLFAYISVSIAGGTKEGMLRIIYIIFALYLVLQKNHAIGYLKVLVYSLVIAVLGVGAAIIGHVARAFGAIGEYDLVYGAGDNLIVFLFARLGGLDDFILSIASPSNELISNFYNPLRVFQSYINLMLPGNPFDTLPLTLYFNHLFRATSIDDIYRYYSSVELSLPGAIFLTSGGHVAFLPFLIVFSVIIGFFLRLGARSKHSRVFVLVITFNMCYIVRSLSLDDTAYILSVSLIMTFLCIKLSRLCALLVKKYKYVRSVSEP